MTVVEPAEASPRGRRRRAVALGAALAVLAPAGWWLTHPQELGEQGSELGGPVAVGEVFLAGVFAYPAEGDVVLRDAVPRVRTNTADAEVRVHFCVAPVIGMPIGSMRMAAEQQCGELPPLEGQRLARPTPENRLAHLVLEIVPRQAGEVAVEGLDVSYSSGLRRGTQASGITVKVRAEG